MPFASVTSCTSCLLIIALEALGDVVVDDIADVGFVDAHAESDGGNDDIDFLHKEVVLCLCADSGFHAGVIGSSRDVVGAEDFSKFLYFLTRQTINDARLAGIHLNEADNVAVDVLCLWTHLVVEVGTVEGRFEVLGIEDAKVLLNVVAYLVGSSSC